MEEHTGMKNETEQTSKAKERAMLVAKRDVMNNKCCESTSHKLKLERSEIQYSCKIVQNE
jgi:hypothetical protein